MKDKIKSVVLYLGLMAMFSLGYYTGIQQIDSRIKKEIQGIKEIVDEYRERIDILTAQLVKYKVPIPAPKEK